MLRERERSQDEHLLLRLIFRLVDRRQPSLEQVEPALLGDLVHPHADRNVDAAPDRLFRVAWRDGRGEDQERMVGEGEVDESTAKAGTSRADRAVGRVECLQAGGESRAEGGRNQCPFADDEGGQGRDERAAAERETGDSRPLQDMRQVASVFFLDRSGCSGNS